jgi:hypothetical protein
MNNENTIIFTIGRMNPPTSGHMYLVKEMIEKALELNLKQINIILSHTKDFMKNPLKCHKKRQILIDEDMINYLKQQMILEYPEKSDNINNIFVKIICMDDEVKPEYGTNPVMKSIKYILYDLYGYPRDGINMILFLGQDRATEFNWIKKQLDTLNIPIGFEVIGLPRPEGAMSATYIRNLATSGNFEEFKKNMKLTGLSEVNIENLYQEIRNNITEERPAKKSRKKGGATRKTKKRKTKKRKTNKMKYI